MSRMCNRIHHTLKQSLEKKIIRIFILPVQSVPITTKFASSNPAHGEVYSIQLVVIRRRFSSGTSVSSTNKTDDHDNTEIFLKVEINTLAHIYVLVGCRLSIVNCETR